MWYMLRCEGAAWPHGSKRSVTGWLDFATDRKRQELLALMPKGNKNLAPEWT